MTNDRQYQEESCDGSPQHGGTPNPVVEEFS